MDQSYQFYLFILSTTTLFTGIKPTREFTNNWFDAQKQCLGQGLTTERDKSDQPYWTGVYRRLTPWINILGCYSISIESLPYIVEMTMTISSVGMCQEICHHENTDQFAIKMNKCLCIEFESNIHTRPFHRLSASDCNFECDDNSDDIYSGDCGGESAYNIYEIQGVHFNPVESCLSLQCSPGDTRFIPQNCSESLNKMCENSALSNKGYASSWNASMEQCRKSQPSTYLLGDINLNDSHLVCERVPSPFKVVWVGVVRQTYTSIDQGRDVREEEREAFLECQICEMNECLFRSCFEMSTSSIFCNNNSDDNVQGANDKELALKISLPVIIAFTILLLCAMAVVFYTRRRKMANADRTTKAQVKSGPRENVDSNVDCVQNNSYFVSEQCPQNISKGSASSNESPYNISEEGVYDHLREKKSRKPEVEDTYQHASAGVSRDMTEYDTMANAVNKKLEEEASYDYSHQDTNGNYACDIRAKNHLTDDPYDVAT